MKYHLTDLPPSIRQNIRVSEKDCWLWTAFVTRTGYGEFFWDRRFSPIHKTTFKLLAGIPARVLVLEHLCPHKHCVNPGHMRLVGRQPGQTRKSHCLRGHLLDDANVKVTKRRRACRQCILDDTRIRRGWYAMVGLPAKEYATDGPTCKNGHVWADDNNLRLDTNGWKVCRGCDREKARRKRAKKRAR